MSHSTVVTFQSVFYLPCVGVEYLDVLVVVGTVDSSEELTPVRELHLFARFERDFFVVLYLVIVKDYTHHF